MKGIFCLEGLWDDDLKQKCSVEPLLKMLEMNGKIPFIHHRVATTEEFDFYLQKWKEARYRKYPILYLAFHGEKGSLLIGKKKYSLKRLAESLQNACNHAFLFLASCKTVNTSNECIEQFLQTTSARALFGYRTKVIWILSAALELLILSELQNIEFTSRGFGVLRRKIDTLYSSFDGMGLLLATRGKVQIMGRDSVKKCDEELLMLKKRAKKNRLTN